MLEEWAYENCVISPLSQSFEANSQQFPLLPTKSIIPGINWRENSFSQNRRGFLLLNYNNDLQATGMAVVSEINGLPLGCHLTEFNTSFAISFYVKPEERRHGIAKKLVLASETQVQTLLINQPALIFLDLTIPETAKYAELRSKMVKMILGLNYQQQDVDSFFKILQGQSL